VRHAKPPINFPVQPRSRQASTFSAANSRDHDVGEVPVTAPVGTWRSSSATQQSLSVVREQLTKIHPWPSRCAGLL